MSVVIFCYSRVYYAIRQHNCAVRVPSLQGANNSQGTVRTLEIKTSRVLFAAVFGFFVCWTPFTLILILEFGFKITIPSSTQSTYPLSSVLKVKSDHRSKISNLSNWKEAFVSQQASVIIEKSKQ